MSRHIKTKRPLAFRYSTKKVVTACEPVDKGEKVKLWITEADQFGAKERYSIIIPAWQIVRLAWANVAGYLEEF